MYPLNVILVGCGDFAVGGGETLRTQVRRHLGNMLAPVKTEFPKAADAINLLRLGKDEVVLFAVYLSNLDDLAQLQLLAAAFPSQPILGLRDGRGDQNLFQGALRSGATFAIPVPVDFADLQTALEWISRQYGFVPRQTPVVAVAGVTSGAGATTLALNLAYEAAVSLKRRCILVEAALRLGVLATYVDAEPRFHLHELLDQLDRLDVETIRGSLTALADNLDLLPGPQHAIQPREVRAADLMQIVQYARPLADLVVIDVPCTYDDFYFSLLAAADPIVLVMEQKLPSVRAIQMVRDSLSRAQVASRQIVVINRYDPRVPGFGAEELARHMGTATVPYTVASDFAAINAAINVGKPLRQQAPASPALADIEKLVRPVLKLPDRPAPAAKPGAFRRLVQAFGLT